MSRSIKKAFVTCSKRLKDNAHSIVRRRVKEELRKEEPDILIIESDTREMGLEDWGTVFGLEFDCDEDWKESKEEMRRK